MIIAMATMMVAEVIARYAGSDEHDHIDLAYDNGINKHALPFSFPNLWLGGSQISVTSKRNMQDPSFSTNDLDDSHDQT